MSRAFPSTLTPGLVTFLKSVSSEPIEYSIERFISLLRRRQIHGSKACAIATAHLLRRTISVTRASEPGRLLQRVQDVGKRLVEAAPREAAIGNIVRRVLGLIRDEEDDNRGDDLSRSISEAGSPQPATPLLEHTGLAFTPSQFSNGIAPKRDQDTMARPPLLSSHTTGIPGGPRPVTSMFSILSHPTMRSGNISPANRSGTSTPIGLLQREQSINTNTDIRAEILEGISEIIDELEQADEQIANYALEHILPTETIMTYSSSQTVQRFLLKAASKRKFTVFHAEAYPNHHSRTHAMLTGNSSTSEDENPESFQKTLTAAGITVILIPDSSIFALMPKANKVILSAHAVLSNASILAPSGSKTLIKAARFHRVPVLVLAATYKLSPIYPYNPQSFIEYGDVGKVIPYQDERLRNSLQGVKNPLLDFVEGEGNVDLFITNVGSVATGYMYKVVKDQYRDEDVEL